MKLDTSSSHEVRAKNEMGGGLHSSSDCISLKTHQMTPPTTLWSCPSFGLDPKSIVKEIGHFKFVWCSDRTWSGWKTALFQWLHFTQNSPNDSSLHIMMLPKLWAQSETNWSKKWDTSSSYVVCTAHGVVGGLHSSSDWTSLKTNQMTSSAILWCCLSFGFDPKSIGTINGPLQVRTKFVTKMEWL